MFGLIALAVLPHVAEGDYSHSSDLTDTVRYNRDEFGVTLHVPSAWNGEGALLFEDAKHSIRSSDLVRIDRTHLRARFAPGEVFDYAFWVDRQKYRKGKAGLVLDATGAHVVDRPNWYHQRRSDYPEVKPPTWPGEGTIFYALNTDKFGDGTDADKGALSFARHLDYVKGLGVNALWLTSVNKDSDFTAEDVDHLDWHVVAESSTELPRFRDLASTVPPPIHGDAWRVKLSDGDAHAAVESSQANGVQDRRWNTGVCNFIRDERVSPSEIGSALKNLREDYPDIVSSQMVNRFGGPGGSRPAALFRGDRARQAQAWLLLLTLPGVPVIDSGDEIGQLEPDSRMEWNQTAQDTGTLALVRQLCALRIGRPSLYRGDFQVVDMPAESHVFAYTRTDRQQTTIILVNNFHQPEEVHVPVSQFGSADFRDLMGGNTFTATSLSITITVPARGWIVIGN